MPGRAVLTLGLGLLVKALTNPMFRHLFGAQIVGPGLLGRGLAGEGVGTVLGTDLAIKMVALLLAPRSAGLAERGGAAGVSDNALSLLRTAEDLERVASSIPGAALLTVVSFPVLFVGTVVGFGVSALLVGTARRPLLRRSGARFGRT